jgi:hypothetical protein
MFGKVKYETRNMLDNEWMSVVLIAYNEFVNACIFIETIISSYGTFVQWRIVIAAHSDCTVKHIRPRLSTAATQCSHSCVTSAVFVIVIVDLQAVLCIL